MTRIIKTSYSGDRLKDVSAEKVFSGVVNDIVVRTNVRYQTHLGFGGAFTDSTVTCYNACSEDVRKQIVDAYYSESGLNYNLARLTVHSSDFSEKSYIYTDGDDIDTFSLDIEDKGRLPLVKRCMDTSKQDITFFAAPWSPPAFAKTNGNMNEGGKLKDEYRAFWAEYYARYLCELKKRGIDVKYVAVQNEPEAIQRWESREVDAIEEGMEIRDYLAPAFKKHGLDVKFYLWDHNRDRVVRRTIDTMSIPGVKEHVWGVGYHWYCCDRYENLSNLHTLYPDLHILLTECCVELAYDSTTGLPVEAGLWDNGQRYALQIINDLNNYSEGYIDWNLVLDENGGPNHKGNFCEAPVMLDGKGGITFKPSYWHIAHFSKYIQPGATRVFCSGGVSEIYQTAYQNPDGSIALVALNRGNRDVKINIDVDGNVFGLTLEGQSIVTVLL